MIDQVLISKFYFSLLNANFNAWKQQSVYKNDFLIVLRKLDLTRTAIGQMPGEPDITGASWATAVAAERTDATYWKSYEQARKEINKTGKIKGFEVLNLRSMQKLWISHYDFDFLEKQNGK